MIPKTIHYIWVGDEPKSKLINDCIATWHKKLPDYKIIEWNENNFDMHENRYIEEAYAAKKWAFVSDYIRARVLYERGGIYLDTDVRVLASFDGLLPNRAFIGFENQNYLSAAILGAEKGHPFIKDIIAYYHNLDFKYDDNNEMAGVNSLSVTDIVKQNYGLKLNNTEQYLKDGLHIYPDGVLCNPSAHSKSIHLFTGTWLNGQQSWRQKLVTAWKRHISTPAQAGFYEKLIR